MRLVFFKSFQMKVWLTLKHNCRDKISETEASLRTGINVSTYLYYTWESLILTPLQQRRTHQKQQR